MSREESVVVLGVDQSLRHGGFAAVKLREHMPPEFLGARSYILSPDKPIYECLMAADKRIFAMLRAFEPNIVFIESGSYAGGGRLFQLGMVAGVVAARIARCKLTPRNVTPCEWMSFVFHSYNSRSDMPNKDTEEYNAYCRASVRYDRIDPKPIADISGDEIDAYLMACYGAYWAQVFYNLCKQPRDIMMKFIDKKKITAWNRKNRKRKKPLPRVTTAAILENRELMEGFIKTFS